MPIVVELDALDFASLVRSGEMVCWGQASAEPLALTSRLMAQRARIGAFKAFIGISLSETPDPANADCVRFSSFCGTGTNRRLASAGALDIFPLHYSDLATVRITDYDLEWRLYVTTSALRPRSAATRALLSLIEEVISR